MEGPIWTEKSKEKYLAPLKLWLELVDSYWIFFLSIFAPIKEWNRKGEGEKTLLEKDAAET